MTFFNSPHYIKKKVKHSYILEKERKTTNLYVISLSNTCLMTPVYATESMRCQMIKAIWQYMLNIILVLEFAVQTVEIKIFLVRMHCMTACVRGDDSASGIYQAKQ